MNVQIKLTELEKALALLLRQLREAEGETIELEDVDAYWSVPPEALYDPYQEPTGLTLGQLSDDLEAVQGLAEGAIPPVSLDLVKVAALLEALGRKTVW